MDGAEIILDADADTSITADTDDQIDFKIGGTDTYVMKAASFDINGQELILDADADTSLHASTDDQIDVKIGGTDQFTIKDGVIEPTTDNDVDLGATTKEFKDLYIDGTAYIDTLDIDVGLTGAIFKGYTKRSTFTWKDADEIYIGAGTYDCNGKIVYWDSQLTTDIGLPDASDWYYLYIDDSDISASGSITAAEFVWANTEPAWSHSLHGWYNGNDRCIFAVLTDGSSNIIEFHHDGGDLVTHINDRSELANTDIDTTYTDVDCKTSVPVVSTKIEVGFTLEVKTTDGGVIVYAEWRVNTAAGAATGHFALGLERIGTDQLIRAQATVYTDSAQIFEVRCSRSDADAIGAHVNGWYLPAGM
jgi:hypothetical protein